MGRQGKLQEAEQTVEDGTHRLRRARLFLGSSWLHGGGGSGTAGMDHNAWTDLDLPIRRSSAKPNQPIWAEVWTSLEAPGSTPWVPLSGSVRPNRKYDWSPMMLNSPFTLNVPETQNLIKIGSMMIHVIPTGREPHFNQS